MTHPVHLDERHINLSYLLFKIYKLIDHNHLTIYYIPTLQQFAMVHTNRAWRKKSNLSYFHSQHLLLIQGSSRPP